MGSPLLLSAYIAIAGSDFDRSDLFKPAPYLLTDTQISPKCLFRVRTQHTKEVPTHNHLRPVNGKLAHTSYGDRSCPFCHSTPVVGNESHYLFGCPSITSGMEPMYVPFKKLFKQSALPSCQQLHHTTKISLPLGSFPPPQSTYRWSMVEKMGRRSPEVVGDQTRSKGSPIYPRCSRPGP
jgi:hypothetical protein